MRFSTNSGDTPDHNDAAPEDRAELDEDFPLGEGAAETSAEVICPYCAEAVEISLDPGSGTTQEYVEDCPVCCQPWTVSVAYDAEGSADVSLTPLDD